MRQSGGHNLEVDRAVEMAREASESCGLVTIESRAESLKVYAEELKKQKPKLAEIISQETGKPLWESNSEVDAMVNKVGLSVEAQKKFRSDESKAAGDTKAITRFKPHGVAAVLGPFNMPGHLPNGHIVPALLAGNSVVFKPSEYTPRTADAMMECLAAAGLGELVKVVHGGRDVGEALVTHEDIDAIYFTGSYAAGVAINKANAHRPGLILALEMGGNNPLVVWDVKDLRAAALMVIQSAFITSGQRCSCARRLLIPDKADALLGEIVAIASRLRVGRYSDVPEPFMGRLISDDAAQKLLDAQQKLTRWGGLAALRMQPVGKEKAYLSPGIIDMTLAVDRPDEEFFGPLLQVIRCLDFEEAIDVANNTRFGLSAGLLSDRRELFDQFYAKVKAGVIHWNRPTTGASSSLPFGGIGDSGNHRPAGYFSAEYCSYPVAVLESEKLSMPGTIPPGIDM